MSGPYFIELLNHHGDVQAREKLLSLPIHIGRSYRNDIILDDPHTAAAHAIIEKNEAGELILRDLASKNGIYLKEARKQHFVIDDNNVYRLGQTLLRIRSEDYAVTAETLYTANHRWDGWPQALIALVMMSLLALSITWLGDIEENKSSTYITALCASLGMAALWAGMFALANRVFAGIAHFNRHLFILSVGIVSLFFCSYLMVFLAYGFSWEVLTRYGSHIQIAILAYMLYCHLCQISPRKYQRLRVICMALILISSGLVLMKNNQSSNQYSDELYMHEMLPPTMRFSRNHNLSEFNDSISELKTQIEKERQKTLAEKHTP